MNAQYKHKLKKNLRLLCLMLSMVLMANYLNAESVHLGADPVSKEDVIRLLAPEDDMPIKTRGIRLHGGEEKSIQLQEPRALSMEIYFEFDSANLTSKAIEQLSPVGEALRSNELAGLSFVLEGHTDATGEDSYNMQLSERRAQSVKRFFVNQYQLSSNRIQAYGKGETELLNQANPKDGMNRRVKIIAQ
jgi:outer membrane protein OmpA-like peptidoglycan-associated protein